MTWVHRISNIDLERMVADCAECGPASLIRLRKIKGVKRPRCRAGVNQHERNRSPGRHGLTGRQTKNLKVGQSCYVCGKTDNLKVDHCHVTGVIRGILCHEHNITLGYVKDNVDHLAKLIDYLINPPINKMPDEI